MTIPTYLRPIPEAARVLGRSEDILLKLVAHGVLSVINLSPEAPPYVPLFEAAYALRMVERRGLAQTKRIAKRRKIEPDESDAEEVAFARGVVAAFAASGASPDPVPYPFQSLRRRRGKGRLTSR